MKRYVLDSFALLAYCENEAGADKVAEILKKTLRREVETYLCIINFGEMYYIALRECGEHTAELYRSTIELYPIYFINADLLLTLEAAKLKAKHKMSYADAFAVALAKTKKAYLVTGDPELKVFEKDTKLFWLPRN